MAGNGQKKMAKNAQTWPKMPEKAFLTRFLQSKPKLADLNVWSKNRFFGFFQKHSKSKMAKKVRENGQKMAKMAKNGLKCPKNAFLTRFLHSTPKLAILKFWSKNRFFKIF